MSEYALDTNVISYAAKNHPLALPYLNLMRGSLWYISFVALAEIRFGLEKQNSSIERREAVEAFTSQATVLGYDEGIITEYIQVRVHREKMGRPIQFEDAWIAATAIFYDLPLLSHNRKDFEDIPGLNLICFP